MDAEQLASKLALAERMVDEHRDVADVVAALIDTCRRVLDADAVGISLLSRGSQLRLYAVCSHRSTELHAHQSEADEGPCIDTVRANSPVSVAGEEALRSTWPTVGPAMVKAGFAAVHSSPLRWRETALGAMSLFRQAVVPFSEEERDAAQAIADLASRLITDEGAVAHRVDASWEGWAAIELAKGVVAQEGRMDMSAAFDRLRALATARNLNITELAEDLVARAARGPVDITVRWRQ